MLNCLFLKKQADASEPNARRKSFSGKRGEAG